MFELNYRVVKGWWVFFWKKKNKPKTCYWLRWIERMANGYFTRKSACRVYSLCMFHYRIPMEEISFNSNNIEHTIFGTNKSTYQNWQWQYSYDIDTYSRQLFSHNIWFRCGPFSISVVLYSLSQLNFNNKKKFIQQII